MPGVDPFTDYYEPLLDTTYDCADRIVLNAYFQFAQSGGGFRMWWNQLHDTEDNLDDTHLMRMAGRFARRVWASAKRQGIFITKCDSDERMHELAAEHRPTDPQFQGVFCILVKRAPAPVREVLRNANGGFHVQKKPKSSWVNWYSFHIMDREWGHVTIRFCPHPPFNANVILNGHEYVERQALREQIPFQKEDNCFTHVPDAVALNAVAETLRAPEAIGRLVQVCERWIYSSCVCFALTSDQQEQTRFRYHYSVYQAEYSRNLLFERGRVLDQVFNGLIDRTRALLNMRTLKTIFGRKHRPFRKDAHGKPPRFEVDIERPTYDLTVFKIHFGHLTLKMYSKGECVLRIEAVVHNVTDLRCLRGIENLPHILDLLKGIVDRFLDVVHGLDIPSIDLGTWDGLGEPGLLGRTRVAGLDLNRPRLRAVADAILALSPNPNGFLVSELAAQVREILHCDTEAYGPRHAAYDLRKFRAKGIVDKLEGRRRYLASLQGLQHVAAVAVLHDRVLRPVLANAGSLAPECPAPNRTPLDEQYETMRNQMNHLFELVGLAA